MTCDQLYHFSGKICVTWLPFEEPSDVSTIWELPNHFSATLLLIFYRRLVVINATRDMLIKCIEAWSPMELKNKNRRFFKLLKRSAEYRSEHAQIKIFLSTIRLICGMFLSVGNKFSWSTSNRFLDIRISIFFIFSTPMESMLQCFL